MKIAILGWGSLLWDDDPPFADQHGDWLFDGPDLKLEFSRISKSRKGSLTLVIDEQNGNECRVAYAISKRQNPDDAICDLRSREGTILKRIGFYFADGSRKCEPELPEAVKAWAMAKSFDVVVWTGLPSNFEVEGRPPFSVEVALSYLSGLSPEGKAKAAEYVWRAPDFVNTRLRAALQAEPWFSKIQKL